MKEQKKIVSKDNIFYPKRSLNIRGQLHQLDRPRIMGILNLTPDSFYDGGKYIDPEAIKFQVQKMIDEGADIIDLGAASSRPGAEKVAPKDEINRLKPALQIIKKEFPSTILSIDTYHSEVARAAADLGADMINDISGGTLDNEMFQTIAELKLPYILMHMQGNPQNMQQNPQYESVFGEISYFFSKQVSKLNDLGVSDIILDPGFGFGKSLEHNYQLLNRLDDFKIFDQPLLVGVSRKSMVYKLLGIDAHEALNGTTVLHTLALQRGASFLRVHDVKAAYEAIKILTFTQNLI